jgi:hypothetical protein
MKKLGWFVGTCLYSIVGNAQNFEFVAGDTLIRTFYVNDYTTAHSAILNHSDSSVTFQWELITFDHPIGWEFSLCDYPLCYTLGETTGTMDPANAHSSQAFLSINIEAITEDTGFYQIKVWDQLYPDLTDTLTVQMICVPSFAELTNNLEIELPKISKILGDLHIENSGDYAFNFVIYATDGKVVLEQEILGKSNVVIPISNLEKAVYFVQFTNDSNIYPGQKINN